MIAIADQSEGGGFLCSLSEARNEGPASQRRQAERRVAFAKISMVISR
jgi:hypothetical protein